MVAVEWMTAKQVTCATLASDAEMQAYFQGGRRTLKKIMFLQQIGQLLNCPTPLFTCFCTSHELPTMVLEDNNVTHYMFQSGRVTNNLKHLDFPLEFMHKIHSRGHCSAAHDPPMYSGVTHS